jgi:hypothetical protein
MASRNVTGVDRISEAAERLVEEHQIGLIATIVAMN